MSHPNGRVLLALLIPGLVHAADITGRVLNGSQPGGFVPEFSVRLTADLAGSDERLDTTAETDGEGRFRFTGVPGDTADVYVLSANFQGVIYPSRFLKFQLGKSTLETDLLVFEITDDRNVLLLEGHHYIFEVNPGLDIVQVTEVFGLENPTQQTFLSHTPFELPVPHDAEQLEILQGFDEGFLGGSGVRYAGPMRPGHHEGVIRYTLPLATPFRFSGHEVFPVQLVTALVAPMGTKVSGDGLSPMEAVDLGEGLLCDRYQIPVESAGTGFSLTLSVAGPSTGLAWLIVGAFLALSLVIVDWRHRRERPGRRSPEVDSLLEKRNRVLEEVVALETSGLADGQTGNERQRLLDKATALQELIDERSGAVS